MGDDEFIFFCEDGDLEEIKSYYDMRKHRNDIDNINNHLFGLICEYSKGESILKFYLQLIENENQKIDLHYRNDMFLSYAFQSFDINIIKFLLNYADDMNSPYDVYKNKQFKHLTQVEIIKYLVNYSGKQIPIDVVNALFINICLQSEKNLDTVKYLLDEIPYISAYRTNTICYEYFEIAKYIINYADNIGNPIDIHMEDDEIIKNALKSIPFSCEYIKYLFKYAEEIGKPYDIHLDNELLLRSSYTHDNPELFEYIVEYAKKRSLLPFDLKNPIVYKDIFSKQNNLKNIVMFLEYVKKNDSGFNIDNLTDMLK